MEAVVLHVQHAQIAFGMEMNRVMTSFCYCDFVFLPYMFVVSRCADSLVI